MAKVVRFHEFGGPEVLRLEDLDIGEPGAGEVRLRVQAIGLNRAEALFRAGQYLEAAKLPARLGYEAAGDCRGGRLRRLRRRPLATRSASSRRSP